MELLRCLQTEVKRQLQCHGGAGLHQPNIIDLDKQMQDTDYREKLKKLLTQIEVCIKFNVPGWAAAELHHASLLWQVPAFDGDGFVIDQLAILNRNWSLRIMIKSSLHSTDDIWNHKDVKTWMSTSKSTILFVVGNSQSLKRLERFSVEVIMRLKDEPVIHLLDPLPNSLPDPFKLSTVNVLRQLAIQCLQRLSTPKTLGFLVKLNLDFRSASESDWYRLLAELMKHQPRVSIVLDLAIMGSNLREAHSLETVFSQIIQLLQDKTCLRVMILTGRPMDIDLNSVATKMIVGPLPSSRYTPTDVLRLVRSPIGQQSSSKVFITRDRELLDPPGHPSSSVPVKQSTSSSTNVEETTAQQADNTGSCNTDATPMRRLEDSFKNLSMGSLQSSGSDSSTRSTEQWFQMLGATTHEFMYKQEFKSTTPVKIAVLDTGFAYNNPQDKRSLRPYYQRIKRLANFIEGDPDSEAKTDPSGHGTAVAVQILKVSLTAVLYICRVAGPDGVPDKSAIERAIQKASAKPDKESPDGGGWGVDIINMSFGWPYHHGGVRNAIEFARQNGVHLFASTSNDGLLGPPNDILYPARSDSVMAVDAADGLGEHARSAPSSSSQHSRGSRFSAPGLGITSPNTDHIWEGSSFACPIAVGVAALILEFARQIPLNKSPEVQTYLQEMPAMLAMLRRASSEKGPDGLKFLTPWKLIGKAGEDRLVTAWFIVDELRKEYGLEVGADVLPNST
ncbi:hypothetical protein FGSG_09115 [Fusarium graminearum PH-1]|uniref:Peptidase S8/S53 domain-containing protein n=2 Tax=Gibberella zeae (strain ATCC MYA-4620 / CBS 123657 / FGSC 9075 / NRRL 31084 / PH-1) TaxID=229533 RepID=I1RXP1_GIBZE|nr:hypothetical protein FGSG_09115 [Fusarium graminearum PH-1]ESU15643.1 hypothetical protein FGSG_09115 [Fusarium graminearum PH-1]|eukprot:XP_011328673.1 hypothetical protein FGSG_09115 [Fusarium graminearum PH-1]